MEAGQKVSGHFGTIKVGDWLLPQLCSAIVTWYLLVELKGISATFLFLSLIALTEPQDSSIHLSRADSEASPATSRFRMVMESWPALNWARLHRAAIRERACHVKELLSKEAPAKE